MLIFETDTAIYHSNIHMTVRDKLNSFIENYKIGRLDVCYDISKLLVKNKQYSSAMWTLLLFTKRFKREDMKYLPHIHKLIAELLSCKYANLEYISFYQDTTSESWKDKNPRKNNFYKEDTSWEDSMIYIPPKSHVSFDFYPLPDNIDNFKRHEHWEYLQQYKDELNYYSVGIITKEDSWRKEFGRHSTEESRPIINITEIIKQKIKGYCWDTVINFGENKGKTLKELFEFDPKIISRYIERLRHFALGFDFWVNYDVFKAYGSENYWLLLERNIIKLIVKASQDNLLSQINQLEEEYKREYAEDMRFLMSHFDGDDDESMIFRALMNGNGDMIGY